MNILRAFGEQIGIFTSPTDSDRYRGPALLLLLQLVLRADSVAPR
jgi:hypothetical protein